MSRYTAVFVGFLGLLLAVPKAHAQLQVGDDVRMYMNADLIAGYQDSYGDDIASSHGLVLGGTGTIAGSYYTPNFLNFNVTPYYNRSAANSESQSITDSSGVIANLNLFSGSHFPAFVNYNYTYNNTSLFGLPGTPNFATVGTGHGFGVGWSASLPNWPSFSVGYSQGTGGGNVYGTNEEAGASTHTLNMRSSYSIAGWNLYGSYTYVNVGSHFPYFLSGGYGYNQDTTSGNTFGFGASHKMPWNGSFSATLSHSDFSNQFGYGALLDTSTTDSSSSEETPQSTEKTNYSVTVENVNVTFRPTLKLSLYANEIYNNDVNGYFYQNFVNSGGGVPIVFPQTSTNTLQFGGGAIYAFRPNLFGSAQITHYDEFYGGKSYQGTFVSGSLAYNKRLWDTFTFSATVLEGSTNFSNNDLSFTGNVNGDRYLGSWHLDGFFNYGQNVQTYLLTYTQSFYGYGAGLHRKFGANGQYNWSVSYSGGHSGITQEAGTLNKNSSVATAFGMRWLTLTANYITTEGQSILTSTGIQPIPPTPGLPPEGLIVYNAKGYAGSISVNPLHAMTVSATYSRAESDTLSGGIHSNNATDIIYAQLQYRLRQTSVLAGYTKFTQGISASGYLPGSQYSVFVGVSRWFNFF